MVPRAPKHPFAFGELLGLFPNAPGKFLWCACVAQVHAADLSATAAEVDVRVDEPGKDALACRIDLLSGRAHPFRNFCVGAYGHNTAFVDNHSLCSRAV